MRIPQPTGVVYQGGNEFVASQGSLVTSGFLNGLWTVGSIPAGASATITINYFVTGATAANSYAEVFAADQTDVDSTSANGLGQVNEDDEAAAGGNTSPSACDITATVNHVNCNNKGTPNNGNDDTYGFTITATANNGSTTYRARFGTRVKTALYGESITFTGVPINGASGQSLNVIVEDVTKSNCSQDVSVTIPSTCSNGTTTNQGVDLALTATSAAREPAVFGVNNITLKVTNSGTQAAAGVVVSAPSPTDVVYTGGNEFTASQGTLSVFGANAGTWTVGDIAPGATATIVINYFSLSQTGYTQFAEVAELNQNDVDSSPGNGNGSSAVEDDEAFLDLTFGARSALRLDFYPNPALQGDQITLRFESSGSIEVPVLVSDLNGRIVLSSTVQFSEGWNVIPVDISSLSSGIYILSFSDTGLMPTRLVVR